MKQRKPIIREMNLKKMLLTTALGLTASALSSYAAQVNVIDVFNLTGQGPLLITNYGGGNQHQQSKDPVFAFNAANLPRIIFQRLQFSSQPSDYSYVQIYKGTIKKTYTTRAAPPRVSC